MDDEEGILLLLTRILESTGYTVRTATNADDALRSATELAPAVALCDVNMTGQSGLWLTGQIQERSPTTAIFLVTADVPDVPNLPDGVIGYILKPFDPDGVRAAVAQAYASWSGRSGLPVPELHPKRRDPAATAGP